MKAKRVREPYVAAKIEMAITVFVEVKDGMSLFDAMEHARKCLKWNVEENAPRICKGGNGLEGRMMTQKDLDRWNAKVEKEERLRRGGA